MSALLIAAALLVAGWVNHRALYRGELRRRSREFWAAWSVSIVPLTEALRSFGLSAEQAAGAFVRFGEAVGQSMEEWRASHLT